MRLWSIHPCFLDSAGLVAAWREALLARAVLRGATRGYRAHPQLARFRSQRSPVTAINAFLAALYAEAQARGYRFDARKLGRVRRHTRIPVERGQLEFEMRHLRRKLKARNPAWHRSVVAVRVARPHPLFRIRSGGIAAWERL
jgi:hypothetical protein